MVLFRIHLILFLYVSYQTLSAQTQTATRVNFGFSLLNLNYKEFKPDGGRLNHEYGVLTGINIGMSKTFKQNFILIPFAYHAHEVHYQGETQAGKSVSTQTDEKILDFSLQLGRQLKQTAQLSIQAYTGLGYHHWQRTILSTATVLGLLETYQWGYGILGIKGKLPIGNATSLQADFALTYPILPRIKVDFNGIFDAQQFALTEQWGRRFALAWQYQYSEVTKVILEPYLEHWHFDASDRQTLKRQGKVVGSVLEPQSKMHNYGFMIYLSRRF